MSDLPGKTPQNDASTTWAYYYFCAKLTFGENSGLVEAYLTESAYKVALQKPIPAQICQLILYISNNKGWVDGFVW